MQGIKVNNLSKVDTRNYKEGTVFITDQSVGVLLNGTIETLVKQSELRKIIRQEVNKKVKKDGE